MTDLRQLKITALPEVPLIQKDDALDQMILEGLQRAGLSLQTGDAVVVTSKIVSKSEGRQFDLRAVEPSAQAFELAEQTGKDPRIVELVLQEAQSVSRVGSGVLVVQHRLGFISANGGIDQSNVDGDDNHVLLLPLDPDASAERLRHALRDQTGAEVGVVISDSHGRPFRMGNVGVAIGVAGLPALLDLRGNEDLFGRVLKISMQGYADMVASAANLLTGEGSEGRPIVHLRGLEFAPVEGHASELNRPAQQSLY